PHHHVRSPRGPPPPPTTSTQPRPAPSPPPSPAADAQPFGDGDERFVLLHPVPMLAEGGKRGRERRVVPAPGDPRRHVDDAHRPQWLAEAERRAIERAEHLVALEDVLTRLARLLGVARREQPDVLRRRAAEKVV